jgi:hypothetical protein
MACARPSLNMAELHMGTSKNTAKAVPDGH